MSDHKKEYFNWDQNEDTSEFYTFFMAAAGFFTGDPVFTYIAEMRKQGAKTKANKAVYFLSNVSKTEKQAYLKRHPDHISMEQTPAGSFLKAVLEHELSQGHTQDIKQLKAALIEQFINSAMGNINVVVGTKPRKDTDLDLLALSFIEKNDCLKTVNSQNKINMVVHFRHVKTDKKSSKAQKGKILSFRTK